MGHFGELGLQKNHKIQHLYDKYDFNGHYAVLRSLDAFFEMNTKKYVFQTIFNRKGIQ
jgi:hypothetical protein